MIRRRIRWAVRHGLVRRTVRRQLRTGDLGARLMFDPAVRAEPFAHYAQLRAQGPVVHNGFAFSSAHHDVCRNVLRSPDFGCGMRLERLPKPFRLALKVGGRPVLGPTEPPSMLVVDAPEHTRYRKLVTRAFSTRAVTAWRTRVEEIAEELLDEIAAADSRGDGVDLVERYASLLPATVIAEMLGAPVAMRRQFLDWGAGAALSLDVGLSYREFRRAERNLGGLQRWMRGQCVQIRRAPRDDLLSSLVGAQQDGQLSTEELSSIAMLLLVAGFETTVNLLGSGAVLLMRHPDQLDLLRAQPQLWANAVEEMLRYDSPVQRTGRVAHQDTEVAGTEVRAGSFILLLLGGANRDPEVFPDPDRFDVQRAEAREHLAFSSGSHYCVGAALARVEGEVGLRTLFQRFPDLALAGTPRRRPTRVLRGYDSIPVSLNSPTPSTRSV